MGKETEKILQLLNHWQRYIKDNPPELSAFAQWLLDKKPDVPENEITKINHDSPSRHYILSEYSTDDQISMLWGRLIRYTHLWSKKALQNLSIHSLEEYGLLKSVELLKSARKSDLVRYSLLENTTCFEMIKRLIRSGFLKESVDSEDKRSRRVATTLKGKKVLQEADQQMKQLSVLLMGDLEEEQKYDLLQLLQQLNIFHENLYHSDRKGLLNKMMGKSDF
ncbi:MarR family winged helix-turn-helix transcriptional regulator [Catalinimonas niigatensis]|uniref:MarR family winged helix-turn-helix transcriptional regulator n=1 Tax=Catalinimonas niigatensis TaxID=1397264 RepID=UPI002665132D|nr:winged helix DNA-binding protein [Catalinimonas niigatensis]WPP51556.1 winged helix DNA-binding protein [Catalinimonas niigatensis]